MSMLTSQSQNSASLLQASGGLSHGDAASTKETPEDKAILLDAAEKSAKEAAKKSHGYVGILARFDYQKGYGFVTCEETHARFGKDIYLAREYLGGAEVLDSIIFSVGFNDKGPRAQQVRRLPDLTRRRKDFEADQVAKQPPIIGPAVAPGAASPPAASLPNPLKAGALPGIMLPNGGANLLGMPLGLSLSIPGQPGVCLSGMQGLGSLGGQAPAGLQGLSVSGLQSLTLPGLQGISLQPGLTMQPNGLSPGVPRTI